MPDVNTPNSTRFRGWFHDQLNGVLEAYYNGTRIFGGTASALTIDRATTVSSTLTTTGALGVTGGITATTGGFTSTTSNVYLGTPGAFATTQPQAAVIMGGTSLTGIAPAGAITTAGAIFASDTVVRKIIAAGTVSNIET